MNEEQKIKDELKALAPELEWPNTKMEVPDDYFQSSSNELMDRHRSIKEEARLRRIYIALSAIAAAILFLFLFTNVIEFSANQEDPFVTDWELAQLYLTENIDKLATEELAYMIPEEEIITLDLYELNEQDWKRILEDWTYEMDDETIQKLKTELQ